ncbi:MAG: BREX-1 system phosphatase PglZ type A, partial [Gemmatimonadetes bacterium]|nr:BREX-1 system phosphatase PglZ type A [Gemmatimonadota bacterium]
MQINAELDKVFNDERVRIVFWNDPDGEFAGSLPDIALEGVEVLKLDEVGALEAKVRIEKDYPTGRYLLYSRAEEPDYENDWFLDMRLYGRSFRADRASIILRQLGLAHQHLRQHLAKRRKFFDNKERLHKLTSLVSPEDLELDLDRKMLAVVAKADQPELFNIVRTLFHSMTEDGVPDLAARPLAWGQIERFELDEPFWIMAESTFGYGQDSPTLQNLLIRLLVSDYAHHLAKELPGALKHLQLPRSRTANAVVCLAQWRDSSSTSNSYDVLSSEVGARLYIPDHLRGCEAEELLDVMTFLDVEKRIVQGLLDRVTSTSDAIDPDAVSSIVDRRQAGHWLSSGSVPEAQRNARRSVYKALAVAARLLHLRNTHEADFDSPDMAAMYKDYESGLFRFDQLYRHFCENAEVAARQGWDMLKPLREEIEACYCNGYLNPIALAWGKFVGEELPERWAVDDVQNQYHFFDRHVGPWLNEAENRRAFIIISDAMRYEVAEELTGYLNGTYRVRAKLSSQLGVLPSYTALGMASLLPHSKLEYSEKGDVLADENPTGSLEQRNGILGTRGGMAAKADQLLAMKKEEGRKFIAGKSLVYIYHDEIDARGDKATTEGDTFEAVRKTIQELADLVRYVVNNLNGNYVVITADHGFLFTETAPGTPDKSRLED